MADFGEILRTIGDFGLFQKLILFGLCFPNLILPFHLASLIFIQSDPECHCNTDWILRAGSNLSSEEQLNLTVPREEDGAFSRCLMFTPVDWDIDTIREHGLNQTTECQNGWVYNKIMYEATIVTDFDLVCGKANVVGLAQTVFMAGILLGSLLFGPFAESFGRQRATQIPMVIMLIFTVTTGLSPNFYLYLASQFLVGIAYGGFRINGIVLATEWVGVTRRSYASCLSQTFGGVGQCILAGMIFFIRDWRLAQFVMAAPIAVVAVYIWFIPESARWLLDQGKSEEAKKLILRVAAINKRTVPDTILEKIAEEKVVQKGGVLILIRSPVLRKYFLTITLGWFSLNLSYYCLSFNVGNFGLDIFLTQLMFGLTEIPGHILCIFILEYLGRKISLMSTLLTGGFTCFLILAVPQDNAVAITALAAAGRFFMNNAGSICNVYVQELFPTSVRQTATGLGSIAIRIAGMLSPMLNILATYHWSIPTIVFSSLSLAGGALVVLLPETRRTELPDSTDEAEGKRNVTTTTKKKVDVCDCEKSTKL
ncbi:solute carrier family 22 member 13 isoform X2 [Coregonus clupeaformis]|uniref:solute carrier family 22 member 13 isoform X2 n=1 Tax=Coregonus clupeaformis TaxID=59861 RepID=UPI001BE0B947|nr:solute carrier family 22 member 13 isoform X2 [Coregonus clupeaformis]